MVKLEAALGSMLTVPAPAKPLVLGTVLLVYLIELLVTVVKPV